MEVQTGDAPHHYAAVVLDGETGREVRGYDYRALADARRQLARLLGMGLRAEVWAMDVWGNRVGGAGVSHRQEAVA